eukprot:SAG31_NODE_79_length_27235_cov_6.268868_3_plen_2702_part_00
MYLMMNTDVSGTWGWPDCPSDICTCCYDCKNPECTTCMEDIEGSLVNTRQWLADLCETLPADYLVDHLRVWQKQGHENVGCDPPDYPTKGWIHHHHENYQLDQELAALDENLPLMEEPLKYVNAGGLKCSANFDCGHGLCVDGLCECEHDWTGPRCLAASAGPSKLCKEVTNLTKSSKCSAPRGLVVNRVPQLQLMIDAQCSLLRSAEQAGAVGAARVCDLVHWDGTYGECSSEMRADLVLQAWNELSSGHQCCSGLGSPISHFDTYNASLRHFSCVDTQSPDYAGIVLCALAALCVVALVLRSIGSSVRRRKTAATADQTGLSGPSKQYYNELDIGEIQTREHLQEERAEMLEVVKHLDTMNTDEMELLLTDIMGSLQTVFGFQSDSICNQREHIESLLRSERCRMELTHDGPPSCRDALSALHSRQFRVFEKWRESCVASSNSDHNNTNKQTSNAQDLSKLVDLCLWWAIWGEAGNVRFMPELLLFIFAAARETYNGAKQHAGLQGLVGSTRMKAGDFLAKFIRPVYQRVFEATADGLDANGRPTFRYPAMTPADAPNYDDFNEMFWEPARMCSHLVDADGAQVLTTAADGRAILHDTLFWQLPHTKWNVKKTHNEVHSWAGVAAGFSRIWIVHALTFVGLTLWVYQPDTMTAYHIGGAIAPAIGLAAQAISLFVFGTWPSTAQRAAIDVARAFLHVLVILFVIVSFSVQDAQVDSASIDRLIVFGCVCGLSVFELLFVGPALAHSTSFERKLQPTLCGQTRSVGAALFWLSLWSAKLCSFRALIMPAVVGADRLLNSILATNLDTVSELGISHQSLVKLANTIITWAPPVLVYVADTLMWMNVALALLSTIQAIQIYGHVPTTKTVCFMQGRSLKLHKLPYKLVQSVIRPSDHQAREADTAGAASAHVAGIVAGIDVDNSDNTHGTTTKSIRNLSDPSAARVQAATRSAILEFPMFCLSDPALIDDLSALLVPQSYLPHTWLVQKGDIGNKMWFIRSGRVEVLDKRHGQAFMLKGPGEYFGELALLHDRPRSSYVRTVESLETFTLETTALENLLLKYPALKLQLSVSASLNLMPQQLLAFGKVWNSIVDSMFANDLLSMSEVSKLRFGSDSTISAVTHVPPIFRADVSEASASLPKDAEARRRIIFLTKSLNIKMPTPFAAEAMPGLSVLIPHYSEPILLSGKELWEDPTDAGDEGRTTTLAQYLVKYHTESFKNHLNRLQFGSSMHDDPAGSGGAGMTRSPSDLDRQLQGLRRHSDSSPFGSSTSMERLNGTNVSDQLRGSNTLIDRLQETTQEFDRVSNEGGSSPKSPRSLARSRQYSRRGGMSADSNISSMVRSMDEESKFSFEAASGAAMPLRKWASMRTQTLYRTVDGMLEYHRALDLLLSVQRPELTDEQRDKRVQDCCTVVVAMQKYSTFAEDQLKQVDDMLENLPSSLCIAYIDEDIDSSAPQGRRFFSCLIDKGCDKLQSGRREPRFRIELPGMPILGNGKSDNQNHAIIFTRGDMVQCIDANQEGYLEEALKLPVLAAEMAMSTAQIIGIREHIFSATGTMGDFAASSELVFGSLFQRALTNPLGARMHYGHPDVMDKLEMIAQGGVSKATRGLNLSEDIFAGMDLTLRGGNIDFKEYMCIGKGRGLGFASVLGFFAKLSMGTAEQSITRQSVRLGMSLPLERLFSFFYAHVGYYVSHKLMCMAVWAYCFLLVHHALSDDRLDSAGFDSAQGYASRGMPGIGSGSSHIDIASLVIASSFGLVCLAFMAAQLLPLLLQTMVDEGIDTASRKVLLQIFTLAPIYFVFQTKMISSFLTAEIQFGGATYINVGRGLGTSRSSFLQLYSSFAPTCMYDGAELALFVTIGAGAAWQSIDLGWAWWLCICLFCTSWLFAPFLFNPYQFTYFQMKQDFKNYWLWLINLEAKSQPAQSWVAWIHVAHTRTLTARHSIFLFPGHQFAVAFVSLVLIKNKLNAHDLLLEATTHGGRALTAAEHIFSCMPLLSGLIVCCLACTIGQFTSRRKTPPSVLCAVSCVCVVGMVQIAEMMFSVPSSMRTLVTIWPALLMHKLWTTQLTLSFCTWCLPSLKGILHQDDTRSVCVLPRNAVVYWVAANRLLLDVILAHLIMAALWVVWSIPAIGRLHTMLMFRVLPSTETDGKNKRWLAQLRCCTCCTRERLKAMRTDCCTRASTIALREQNLMQDLELTHLRFELKQMKRRIDSLQQTGDGAPGKTSAGPPSHAVSSTARDKNRLVQTLGFPRSRSSSRDSLTNLVAVTESAAEEEEVDDLPGGPVTDASRAATTAGPPIFDAVSTAAQPTHPEPECEHLKTAPIAISKRSSSVEQFVSQLTDRTMVAHDCEAMGTGAAGTGTRCSPGKAFISVPPERPPRNHNDRSSIASAIAPRNEIIAGALLSTQFPKIDCHDKTPLMQSNPEVIQTIRNSIAKEAMVTKLQRLCEKGTSFSIALSLFQRGLDGPGSSQDLPFWQQEMTLDGEHGLEKMPKTPTFASSFALKMKFIVSAAPPSGNAVVEYVAPMYGLTEVKPKVWDMPVTATSMSQLDAPGYVFLNLCGLTGLKVRVLVESIDIMAKEGGMGSSGAFNAGLLLGASLIMGAGLSEGDVLAIGTKLENAEFRGLTGGQELLSSLVGGATMNVWLSGRGKGYNAFLVPLIDKEAPMNMLCNSAVYCQAGKGKWCHKRAQCNTTCGSCCQRLVK